MPSERSGGKSEGLLTLIYEFLDIVHMRGKNEHDSAVSMETSHNRAVGFVVLPRSKLAYQPWARLGISNIILE